MIKSKLVTLVTNKFKQLSEKDIETCVNHVLELMCESLEKNRRIEIRGFGSFSLHNRPARNAHNPRTGERVVTMQKYAPHFKPGKELRERINLALANNIKIARVK